MKINKKILTFIILILLVFGFCVIYILFQINNKNKKESKIEYPKIIINRENVIDDPTKEDLENLVNDIKKQNGSSSTNLLEN